MERIKTEPEDYDDSETKFSFEKFNKFEIKEENIKDDSHLPILKAELQVDHSVESLSTLSVNEDGIKSEIEINDNAILSNGHEPQESLCEHSSSLPESWDLNMQRLVKIRGKKGFKCNLCDCSNTVVQTKVKKHFKCSLCNKTFLRSSSLTAHKRSHPKRKTFLCLFCSKSFPNKSLLSRHQQIYGGKMHDCMDNTEQINEVGKSNTSVGCEESNNNRNYKSSIQDSNHSKESSHKCKTCNKAFFDFEAFVIHLHSHTKTKVETQPFICKICSNTFFSENDYNMHVRIHNGEKPFKCSVCELSYQYSYQLKAHFEIHLNEECVNCDVCGKSFYCRKAYRLHRRTHTQESNIWKSTTCEVCSKTFKKSGHLSLHMRVHSGDKPFVCDVCSKSFSTKCTLVSHLRIHSWHKRKRR